MNHDQALVIVDEQRGFMPAEEGGHWNVEGFGELTVPNGHRVVYPTNRMTEIFLDHNLPVLTTQDMHPVETAHFSDEPNFVDTWPEHCVAGTPGAEFHPRLIAADNLRVAHFIKGDVAAVTPADDDSYSGALAHRAPEDGEQELLPDYLRRLHIVTAYVCGLTVGKERPLCVDSTALDLKALGFDVAVVTDAVEAVVPADKEACLRNLGEKGIRLTNSHDVVAEIAAIPEVVR